MTSKKWEDFVRAKYGGCIDPIAKIKIDSKAWKDPKIHVSHIDVLSSSKGEAGTCSVSFVLPNVKASRKKIELSSSFAKIKIGVPIEIELGYKVSDTEKTENVFKGYISWFDLELSASEDAIITLQAMDAKMWMMSGKKTELKKNKRKYSDVVKDVCRDYVTKLGQPKVKIEGEPTKLGTPIYQRDESDYEFLCRMASVTGSMFYMSSGKLYFISPSAVKTSPSIKIDSLDYITHLKVSMNIWGMPKAVQTIGIDPKNFKNTISAKVTSSDMIGSGKAAASLTRNISSANVVNIVDNGIRSVSEAKFISEAEYNKREFNLVSGEFESPGIPDVDLGTFLKIKNMGDPIDNSYIITGVEHHFDGLNNKYTTKTQINTNRFSPQTSY